MTRTSSIIYTFAVYLTNCRSDSDTHKFITDMNIKLKLAFVAAVGLFVACTQTAQQSSCCTQEATQAPDTTMVSMRGNALPVLGHQPVVGEMAPDFTAVRLDMSDLTLSSLKGTRVVLNIFPSIDTGVCAQSVRAFNERAGQLENTLVLCVSKDLPFAQGRFCGAEGIDKVMTVSMFRNMDFDLAYGVRIAEGPFAGLFARAVVVIDAEGKVIHHELVSDISKEPNYEAVIQALS